MRYSGKGFGCPVSGKVDRFTKLCDDVVSYLGSALELTSQISWPRSHPKPWSGICRCGKMRRKCRAGVPGQFQARHLGVKFRCHPAFLLPQSKDFFPAPAYLQALSIKLKRVRYRKAGLAVTDNSPQLMWHDIFLSSILEASSLHKASNRGVQKDWFFHTAGRFSGSSQNQELIYDVRQSICAFQDSVVLLPVVCYCGALIFL